MGTWSSFCALLLIFSICDPCQASPWPGNSCQTGWVQFQCSCYKAVMERKNWHDAEVACQSYGTNAHLASIHSTQENDFIFNLMGKPLDYSKGKAYWIGAHDVFKEGNFMWTDGTKFDFQSFPSAAGWNGGTSESYLGSWFLENGQITWNDYALGWYFPFICKYSMRSRCYSLNTNCV